MARTIIRIPRTTAMFVTGLGRILREHLGFSITEHEHWRFEHAAEWSECDAPGNCSVHSPSHRWVAELVERAGPCLWPNLDQDYASPCLPYKMNVYLGVGQVWVSGEKVELRVRIEESRHDMMGGLFTVRIWVRDEAGNITAGEFVLHDDGRSHPTDKPVPGKPPRRIAFWR